jgi:hypothetical protein
MSDDVSFDPGTRHLCPDGSCTGILDARGRCSECGRLGEAAPAADADAGGMAAAAPGSSPLGHPAPGQAGDAEHGRPQADSGFDESRSLCPDGSCVGVLDAHAYCPVCGKFADGGPAAGATPGSLS